MGTKCSPVNSLTAMCIFPVGKPSWCEQDVPFDSLLCLQFLLWDPLDGNKMFPLTHCYVYSSCCETLLMETKCSQWLTAMCIVPVGRPSWWEQNIPIDSLLCVQFLLWDPLDGNTVFPLTHCYVYSSCCEALLMGTKCSHWLTPVCIVPVGRPSWLEQNVPQSIDLCWLVDRVRTLFAATESCPQSRSSHHVCMTCACAWTTPSVYVTFWVPTHMSVAELGSSWSGDHNACVVSFDWSSSIFPLFLATHFCPRARTSRAHSSTVTHQTSNDTHLQLICVAVAFRHSFFFCVCFFFSFWCLL